MDIARLFKNVLGNVLGISFWVIFVLFPQSVPSLDFAFYQPLFGLFACGFVILLGLKGLTYVYVYVYFCCFVVVGWFVLCGVGCFLFLFSFFFIRMLRSTVVFLLLFFFKSYFGMGMLLGFRQLWGGFVVPPSYFFVFYRKALGVVRGGKSITALNF